MKGPIITVASLKGGSGKSTLAACLAVHWRLKGWRPRLIDSDPQRSIVRLAAREQELGGVEVLEDATEEVWKTARALSGKGGPIIVDTPGFRSESTAAGLAAADIVLIPVKPSPLDVDLMMDTVSALMAGVRGWAPAFRCLLTQTTRDSVIARHIRAELEEAGFPLFRHEMQNRVAYGEAALYGATPSMIDPSGPAAQNIAAIAQEVEALLKERRAVPA